MKELLKELTEEHQKILDEIKFFENSKEPDKNRLQALFHFVESEHHEKEERHLFPWIAQQTWLNCGGPLCGFFMGVRLELNPLSRMRQHLEAFYQKHGRLSSDERKFPWLTQQSPLSIPMEEHELGHQLSQALTYLMKSSVDLTEDAFFQVLLQDYFALLRMHIDKEDHCLFVQCKK